MILEGWAQYVPSPGSRYRIRYVPDGHNAEPDIPPMKRALDARPAVAVHEMSAQGSIVTAEVSVYIGDMPLLTVFGTNLSDGDRFWRVDTVERVDEGGSRLTATTGRITDAILDPIEDFGSALRETTRDTVSSVRKVGFPSVVVLVVAAIAFFVAREL